mgnify:FL=1
MKRRPARKTATRTSRNPSRKAVRKYLIPAEDLPYARKMLPRGAILYGILRSQAASGTRTIGLVVAKGKEIRRVPPSWGKAAGLRYNERSDGFVFTGGGYSAMLEAAAALSRAIYGKDSVIKYENSYL